jgi:flagellar motor switch protein FliN/FliY
VNSAANAAPAPQPAEAATSAETAGAAATPSSELPKDFDAIAQAATFADAEGAPPKTEATQTIDELLEQVDAQNPDAAAGMDDSSIEELLKQANFEDASEVAADIPGSDAETFQLPGFQQAMADAQVSSIDLLRDVELNVKIELGRSRMLVEDVLKLNEGSVVELDKLAGDPVDVFVNERLVARGEVLVLNDNFCVRVNEIVAGVKEEGT